MRIKLFQKKNPDLTYDAKMMGKDCIPTVDKVKKQFTHYATSQGYQHLGTGHQNTAIGVKFFDGKINNNIAIGCYADSVVMKEKTNKETTQ